MDNPNVTDSPPPPVAPSRPQPPTFSPWWLFVFGVVVGYVLFRPGGVRDYFFASGGFREPMTVGSLADRPVPLDNPMAPQLGVGAGVGAGSNDSFGSGRRSGARFGSEEFDSDEFDSDEFGRGDVDRQNGSRPAAGPFGGASADDYELDEDSVQGGQDREIRLPPTDLFTGSGGSNSRGLGGAPF